MMNDVERSILEKNIEEHIKLIEIKNEIIIKMRNHHVIETDSGLKFKLEKNIEDSEKDLANLLQELDLLNKKNEQDKIQRDKKELSQQALRHEIAQSYSKAVEKWKAVYELDNSDLNAQNHISRLEKKMQYTNQLNTYIAQLTRRIAEVSSIYRKVIEWLRNVDEISWQGDPKRLIIDQFLQNSLPANAFIVAWNTLEKTPFVEDRQNYSILAERFKRGEIILFLGSDIPKLSGIADLDMESLVENLAIRADYKNFSGSLSMIAQYYEMSDYGRSSLLLYLNNILNEENFAEIKIYKAIARIEQPLVIISATYDMILEKYFREAGKKYALISTVVNNRDNYIIDGSSINVNLGSVIVRYSDQNNIKVFKSGEDLSRIDDLKDYSLIYKIRGHYDSTEREHWQDTWTLTEENYFDFAHNISNIIPAYVLRQFRNRIVYFAGYSTKHWEDRMLVSLILNRARYDSAKVITQTEDPFELAYWRWKKVDVYEADLENFVSQLETYL